MIIKQQIDCSRDSQSASLAAVFSIKRDAVLMKEAILRGDLDGYAGTMRESWVSKKLLAPAVSNSHLDSICGGAMNAGATA